MSSLNDEQHQRQSKRPKLDLLSLIDNIDLDMFESEVRQRQSLHHGENDSVLSDLSKKIDCMQKILNQVRKKAPSEEAPVQNSILILDARQEETIKFGVLEEEKPKLTNNNIENCPFALTMKKAHFEAMINDVAKLQCLQQFLIPGATVRIVRVLGTCPALVRFVETLLQQRRMSCLMIYTADFYLGEEFNGYDCTLKGLFFFGEFAIPLTQANMTYRFLTQCPTMEALTLYSSKFDDTAAI